MSLLDRMLTRAIDRRVSAFQYDLLARHVEEVENIYRAMRSWRHDLHSHLQTLLALTETGERDRVREYLLSLNNDLVNVDKIIKTGNVTADAILNSKLSLIRSHGIEVAATAALPEKLSVSDIDLCVIIGNLLDNALEGCLRQREGERFIRAYIGALKGQLYISVTNTAGEIRKGLKGYLSTKNTNDHGFGLRRIDRITAKYDGSVNRQSEEGVFATEVLLPL